MPEYFAELREAIDVSKGYDVEKIEKAYELAKSAHGDQKRATGEPYIIHPVAAALILADKSDVRRSRVRNNDEQTFDIHDRVNYSVKESVLKINEAHTLMKLKLSVDTRYGTIMDYFEIFLQRMIMCRKASEKLGLEFSLHSLLLG